MNQFFILSRSRFLLAFSHMLNIKFKKSVIFASVLLLQPMMGSFALAKKKAPMRAYSFIAEGGKASQGECDGEKKIPRKLKHLKEFSKAGSYIGSELQSPEMKGKNNEEMWKHIFKTKPACNVVLAKTPSALDQKTVKEAKPELPPEDATDSDREEDQKDGPDTE
jgi:hypothetical protein